MTRKSMIKQLTITALFTAVIFVATSFIKFPIALGYIHLGDVFIMLASFMLPPFYAVISAVVGSVLADLLAGFAIYMPITFLAKGLMALIASLFFYKKTTLLKYILGSVLSSIAMVVCYFIFEGFVYGWAPAVANLPMQFVQPAVAILVGGAMIFSFKKIPFIMRLKDDISQIRPKRVPKDDKTGDK